jgi:hypothetical protein
MSQKYHRCAEARHRRFSAAPGETNTTKRWVSRCAVNVASGLAPQRGSPVQVGAPCAVSAWSSGSNRRSESSPCAPRSVHRCALPGTVALSPTPGGGASADRRHLSTSVTCDEDVGSADARRVVCPLLGVQTGLNLNRRTSTRPFFRARQSHCYDRRSGASSEVRVCCSRESAMTSAFTPDGMTVAQSRKAKARKVRSSRRMAGYLPRSRRDARSSLLDSP